MIRTRTLMIPSITMAALSAIACSDAATTASIDATTSTGTTSTTAGTITILNLDCRETGTVADSFKVAAMLAANTADHELASDYAWSSAAVVPIALNGTSISVTGSGATVSGSTVTITSAGTYSVSGTLSDGQIVVNTKDTAVVRLILNGASITSSTNSGIFVSKAAKAVLVLADNSVNRVTDGATYPTGVDQNAAIFSKANMSIHGSGALTVQGRYKDGITSKDGLVISGGAITVTAVDDGIRGKDYLVVRGTPTLDVTSGGDGMKSDEDGDVALGYVLVQGGTATVKSGGDALSAETDALISNGTLTLKAAGGSSAKISDTLSAKGIKGGARVVVDGGAITIDAADDGLHSNGRLFVNGGTTSIATGDDGVHSDSALTINGGSIDVTKSYEGVENGFTDMVFNGGSVRVVSTDDGINLSGAGDSAPGMGGATSASRYTMRINGGRIAVNAGGDGLDANGSIAMTGGCAIVHGPTANNNAPIDYDGTFQMTGGFIVAAGSSGMAQAPGTTSTQAAVMFTFGSTQAAGTLVHVQSSSGVGIVDFVPSKAFQSLVISSPTLTTSGSYTLYRGGAATGTATDGLYQGGTYSGGTLLKSFTTTGVVSKISL